MGRSPRHSQPHPRRLPNCLTTWCDFPRTAKFSLLPSGGSLGSYHRNVLNISRILTILCVLQSCTFLLSQASRDTLNGVSHSASLTFLKRDGTCVSGPIAGVDEKAVTVHPYGKEPVKIQRTDLLQVSQGDALLFTAVSSWADVATAHVYPHEAFVLKLRSGKLIKGKPLAVKPDSITLKHGFVSTEYKKSEVQTIDYLRVKPESDGFDYFSQEAPGLLFFYPEFYYRLVGLEGRIPVRLYDASSPEAAAVPSCSQH